MSDMRLTARRLILALNKIDEIYLAGEQNSPVSDEELCMMYALDDGQPHSQRDICMEWMLKKSTVNTIVKRWSSEGYITMQPIPGKRREMQILLTDSGKTYISAFLAPFYRAEEMALEKTLDKYPEEFISAVEFFGQALKDAFAQNEGDCHEDPSV